MAKKPEVSIRHAFAHEGKWYTRDNAHEVLDLPKARQKALREAGFVAIEGEETGEPVAPDAVPDAAPVTTPSKKGTTKREK